jgi:hypothetical protein
MVEGLWWCGGCVVAGALYLYYMYLEQGGKNRDKS